MNPNKILYKCTPLLLSVVAGFSGAVNAEEFSLDSVGKGQATRTLQSGAMGVTDVNSTAVQGSLTDTLVKKLNISNEQAQGGAGALFQLAKSNVDYVSAKSGALTGNMLQSALYGGLGHSINYQAPPMTLLKNKRFIKEVTTF